MLSMCSLPTDHSKSKVNLQNSTLADCFITSALIPEIFSDDAEFTVVETLTT